MKLANVWWLLLAAALVGFAACPKRVETCVPPTPPEPEECCQSCEPEDIGCGVLVCKPGTGVNCGPCPRFQ